MPELPEVETIKLGLQGKIIGLRITDVEVRAQKIFQGSIKEVISAKIKKISRRAKILILDLDNGKSLIIHLKLTGQLVYHKDGSRATFGHPIPFAGTTLPAKTTHVIFTFSDGSKLFYNDVRKFGWIKVVRTLDVPKLKIITGFGPEPPVVPRSGTLGGKPPLTLEKFREILVGKKTTVKALLMDQKKIAGVGNIYANEALFLAGIHPQRRANSLSGKEIEKLYKSLLFVLKEGIKYGGSSENAYVTALGDFGKMQEHFRVYGKNGRKCLRCKGVIKRIALGGRGTFFCEHCQK